MALVVHLHPQLSGLAIDSRPHHYLTLFTACTLYTTEGTSSFQVERLLTCGDIAKNPGPKVKPVVKFPCVDCKKSVRTKQDAILCGSCTCGFMPSALVCPSLCSSTILHILILNGPALSVHYHCLVTRFSVRLSTIFYDCRGAWK